MKIQSLDHLVLTVVNIEQSIAFYTRTLGMAHEVFTAADGTKRHALKFGVQKINLHLAGAEFLPAAQAPTPGSADLCFLSKEPLEAWQDHLVAHAITVLEGPVNRTGGGGGYPFDLYSRS